ncbi:hypothetical protein HKX48_004000 [Thoreauomyces humboldtii]|nr:hypothetical protein HKX48_004000 [Thoreauomyces humboldtii]
MTSQIPTNYLVLGSNRGIGFGLVKELALRPHSVVFATVRSTSSQLTALAAEHKNIHIITLDTTSETDAQSAAVEISKIAPSGLDVVIANAGINIHSPSILAQDPSDLAKIFSVNVGGPLIAFKHFYPLLQKKGTRKFAIITSLLGSNTLVPHFPQGVAAYGASKAAVNYIGRTIAAEHKKDGVIVALVHPGHVQTDMGTSNGTRDAPVTVEDSARGILKVIDEATIETSGEFVDYQGKTLQL